MKAASPKMRPLPGFTLTELLVVTAIIAILAVIAITGVRRFIENGRKVKTMALFRDFKVGMSLFEGDYGRPPIPENKRITGWDTIFGDPGGQISNEFLISVLAVNSLNAPGQGLLDFNDGQNDRRLHTWGWVNTPTPSPGMRIMCSGPTARMARRATTRLTSGMWCPIRVPMTSFPGKLSWCHFRL